MGFRGSAAVRKPHEIANAYALLIDNMAKCRRMSLPLTGTQRAQVKRILRLMEKTLGMPGGNLFTAERLAWLKSMNVNSGEALP